MNRIRVLSLTLLTACGGASTVGATGNLVPNPDFDNGLDGWTLQDARGVMSLNTAVGMPTPPSIDLAPNPSDAPLGADALSACFPADDVTHYDFFFNASGGGGSGAVVGFSDSECMNEIGRAETTAFHTTIGTYALTNFRLPEGTRGARVDLGAPGLPLGAGGDTLFDHVLVGPSGSLLDGIAINQEGLTGTWYDPAKSGQGLQFVIRQGASGGGGSLFGAWYTYDVSSGDSDTQRWYSIESALSPGATSASVTIYQNTGGAFDAPPVTAAVAVGTGTLVFDSCTTGEFTYDLDDGRSGAIALDRLLLDVDCAASGAPSYAPSDAGYAGAWYAPSTGGQGFIIDVSPINFSPPVPNLTQVFAGWYTYARDGMADGGASAQRWFSLQGTDTIASGSIALTIYASTGGTFDSGATEVDTEPVGTATLLFLSCTAATLGYAFDSGDLTGISGNIALSRLDATSESCDAQN